MISISPIVLIVSIVLSSLMGFVVGWFYEHTNKRPSIARESSYPPVLGDPESTVVEPGPTLGILLEKSKEIPTAWAPPPPKPLTFDQRLNARYQFADAKTSKALRLLTWKNYAGKRMQVPFDVDSSQAWKRACQQIEDSLHDVRRARSHS